MGEMGSIYWEHSWRLQLSQACNVLELCGFYYLGTIFATIFPTWIKVQPVLGKKQLRHKGNVPTTREELSECHNRAR